MDATEFVVERGRALVQTAYLLTGDLGAAEDLVQTALTKCLPRWDRIEHHTTYVRRVVLTTFLDTRRRGPQPSLRLDDADMHALQRSDDAPEHALREALWSCIRMLPPRERAVVVLRYYEDLDDAEIGELLSLRPSSVRATVSRALQRLRTDHLDLLQDKR